MRLLVDECLPRRLIELLRSKGFDAIGVVDVSRSASDHDVLQLAIGMMRVLVTEDRGFGDHLVRDERLSIGVVILSGYRATHRIEAEMQRIADIVASLRDELPNSITIITPSRIRQRKLEQD